MTHMRYILSIESSSVLDKTLWVCHKIVGGFETHEEAIEATKTIDGFDHENLDIWLITDLKTNERWSSANHHKTLD